MMIIHVRTIRMCINFSHIYTIQYILSPCWEFEKARGLFSSGLVESNANSNMNSHLV